MPTTLSAALEIRGVSHSYGSRRALDHVDFVLAAGTFSVLLGPNGAGKSTLFALIARLFTCRSGTIRVFGYDLERDPGPALRRLGIVFQARTLDPDLSVLQNFLYHAALHGLTSRVARERAGVLLRQIGLAERAADKVRNLSGGQMRRVEIARALIHQPRLLVLDEPTVGLDIQSRADLIANVRKLVAVDGISVLWATHLIEEVADDDIVLVLHDGRIRAQGLVADVVTAAGVHDIRAVFDRLTGAAEGPSHSGRAA
jgi:ABC-2 type transport system ATP-binding protein